jgi:phage gp29-like protein
MALTVYSSKDNQWREYLNPLRGLTLERIVQHIEQGERGAFADLQWFYQAMEKSDALIATVLMRRRAALLSCGWDVKTEEVPGDPVLAKEQADFLREQYEAIENLREAVAFLSSASFRGFAHVEKHTGDGGAGVTRLESVEQWFWCREGMFGEWTYNRNARSGVERGEEIEPRNFVIVEAPMALDRILSVQYFRRNLCMRDWDGFLEVYGIPSFFIVGPPGVTTEKELEYLQIAQSIIKDGRGYLPNGTKIEYVTGGGSGRPPFRDHLDYLDKQITLLGTGGLLTMLAESGSGTLAGSAHQEAFNQVAKADAVMVSEAFQRDFDAPLLKDAFPDWPVEAGFELSMDTVAPGYGPMLTGSLPPAADGVYASKIQVSPGP